MSRSVLYETGRTSSGIRRREVGSIGPCAAGRSAASEYLTEIVYKRLEAAILEGCLTPGQQLLETALAKEYGVSRTPVREALKLLVKGGLAEITSSGIFVTALTVKDVRGLLQTSQALQGLASRLAVERGTEEQMVQLEQILSVMEAATAQGYLQQWIAADKNLHTHIALMGDNKSLVRMVRQMESLVGRVRHLAIHLPGRLAQSNLEHRRIVEAIRARNTELAEQTIQEHLRNGERLIVSILQNFVVPFAGERF